MLLNVKAAKQNAPPTSVVNERSWKQIKVVRMEAMEFIRETSEGNKLIC
jgi:hypothetical protein